MPSVVISVKIGKNWLVDLSFPFYRRKNSTKLLRYLSSLTPEHPVGEIENQVIRPDGSRRWLAWLNYAFFDDQGRVQEFQAVGRDITRLKLVEEALRESETRFRLYTEGSLVGVFVIQDNRLVYVNPVMAEILGYSPQEMTGLPPLDLVHPDDRDFGSRKMAERLAGKQPELYTIRGVKKDGGIVHCEIMGRLMDYQGRPAILGSLLDITQRLRAEEALRESEKKFRLLIETMNDGLGAINNQQRITYVNPKMSELFGYSEAELIGRPLTDLLDRTNQKILHKNLERRRRGDQTPYELVCTRSDGSQFPSIVSPKPLFDAQGKFKGSFAIITDITTRRQAEAVIQRREQYFRQLTENVSDVIGLLTADGAISYLNPNIKRLLGYAPPELLGKKAVQFVHPDDIIPLRGQFKRFLQESNGTYSAEVPDAA